MAEVDSEVPDMNYEEQSTDVASDQISSGIPFQQRLGVSVKSSP